ncbi:MFS transporter [Pseudonocardia asaccharolytica]|uniref:MFS transporter n=1 Tax=Pseudonocardia asaccharolytica TaxID=54010 RepID=UPI0021C07E4C|nr:MFS transporter [Pseudonocardia asaccharolytica]
MYAGAFLGPFGGGVTVAMLPELGTSFAVSAEAATGSLTAYLLPFAAVMLVSGTLGERWGRRRTVVGAYLLYAVASVACVLATTFSLFLVARAAQGIANAFTTPLLLAALGAAAPPERLGRALGWFGSLQAAGQTSAPLVGGLTAELDWRYAFIGVAAVAVLLAAVGIPASPAAAGAARPSLRSAFRPAVLRLGVVAAVGWGCLSGLGFLVALRLEDAFGVGAGPRGLVLTGLGVAGLLSARLVGGGVDRMGPRRCVLLGALLGVGLVLGLGFAPVVGLVAVLWAVGGVATQLVLVGVNALTLSSSEANRGGAMSVVQAVRFGGGALAPAVITPVYVADPLLAFLLPAALLALVVPAAVRRA